MSNAQILLLTYILPPIATIVGCIGIMINSRKNWTGTIDLFIVYWLYIAATCIGLVSFDFMSKVIGKIDHGLLHFMLYMAYIGELAICGLIIVNFTGNVEKTLKGIKSFFSKIKDILNERKTA